MSTYNHPKNTLPNGETDLPRLPSSNDGGKRESSVRCARLDLRNQARWLPGDHGFDSAGKPHLWSRNGLALEAKFPAVATAVSKLKLRSTILDGEVVAVDANGIPRFQFLQRFQKQPTAPTLY